MQHTKISYAQTRGMRKIDHQKLEVMLKINVGADQPQLDENVNIAVIAQNKTYHDSLNCSTTELFHDRTAHSELELKFANVRRTNYQPKDISEMLDEITEKRKETLL